jgi:protein-disulfide isomerase
MRFVVHFFLFLGLLSLDAFAGEEKSASKSAEMQKAEAPKKEQKVEKTDPIGDPTAKIDLLPEMGIGNKEAPVIIVDYSSLTCGHCAEFHTDILPKINEKYIKTGLVRIIFRDYPSDAIALTAAQLAWCRGEMKYMDSLKTFYSKQKDWLLADDPNEALKKVALQNGITQEQYDSCLKNQKLLDRIVQSRLDGQRKYNIIATPTIVINAKVYQHALSFDEFQKIVDPLLKGKDKGNTIKVKDTAKSANKKKN